MNLTPRVRYTQDPDTGKPVKGLNGERPPDTLHAMIRKIASDEGVQGLWSGTWYSLMLVLNPAVQVSAVFM